MADEKISQLTAILHGAVPPGTVFELEQPGGSPLPLSRKITAAELAALVGTGVVPGAQGTVYITDQNVPVFVGNPATAFLRQNPPVTEDDFFDAALDGRWSGVNIDAGTVWTTALGRLRLSVIKSGNAANNSINQVMQAVPAGSWTAKTRVHNNSPSIANVGGGLCCARAGAIITQHAVIRVAGAPTTCRLLTASWTNATTFNAAIRDDNPPLAELRTWWMQMRYDGANVLFDYSADGSVFFNIATVGAAGAIGGAPTTFGVSGNAPSTTTGAEVVFDCFKVYHDANLNH